MIILDYSTPFSLQFKSFIHLILKKIFIEHFSFFSSKNAPTMLYYKSMVIERTLQDKIVKK